MAGHLHGDTAATGNFVSGLFEVFVPRSVCMRNDAALISLHFVSDLLITLAYFSIPLALIIVARRRPDLAFNRMFGLFALFILLCGTTHLFNVIALRYPVYRVDGVIKLITGLVSITVSIVLWRLLPLALELPNSRELADRKAKLERVVEERTAELARSADEYRTLFESSAAGVAEIDAVTGRFLRVNRNYSRLAGRESDDLLGGLTLWDVVHPDDRETTRAAVADLGNGRESRIDVTRRFPRADGRILWAHVTSSVLPHVDGRPQRILSVAVDITERVEAEQAVRRGEAQFRQLAESIPQLAWMARPDGHIFWYNRRWYDYTGTTFEQMEGWGWQSVHDPKALPGVLKSWRAAHVTGEPWEDTFPLRGKDGTFRRFLSRATPLRDGDGRVLLWFGTNTDIEDQFRYQQERERLLAEAQSANRTMDEFIAVLSHELRTPLTAILGWVRLMRSPNAPPQDIREGIEVIERNARSQARMVEDLLDLTRINSGNLRLDLRRIDPGDVVLSALGAVAPAAEAKGVHLESSLAPSAGAIDADPVRLEQIVSNLLTNAVKFTPSGGRVLVTMSPEKEAVEIRVADTGQGIAPGFLPHVFDRFRQADSSSTRSHGGLGLGLAIVKQLAELHGGTVRAESPGNGLGSTFVVRLPRRSPTVHVDRDPSPSDSGERTPTPADPMRGLRVLVVDDEPDARHIVGRIFRSQGAEVLTAESADEADALLDRTPPDILISDIGMPGRDGYDLIRRIRARLEPGAVPAVALTAFAHAEDRNRALAAGFQAHIAKPVDPDELVAVVAHLARRKKSAHKRSE